MTVGQHAATRGLYSVQLGQPTYTTGLAGAAGLTPSGLTHFDSEVQGVRFLVVAMIRIILTRCCH